jgi:hypothetical protein
VTEIRIKRENAIERKSKKKRDGGKGDRRILSQSVLISSLSVDDDSASSSESISRVIYFSYV